MLESLRAGDDEAAAQTLRTQLGETEEIVAAGIKNAEADKI
jgi:DNA-binding GntR family transcriptional regulator